MVYQTEAVLVAVRDVGDADKLVTLFSRDYGKIKAYAYGARRARSQLAGSMQLLTHLEANMTTGKNFDTVKQCDVRNSFRHLREDLTRLAYGMFTAELVTELCPERQPEPEIFDLLLDVLQALVVRNPRIVALAGAWKMLEFAGYLPEFEQCAICGQGVTDTGFFSMSHNGVTCSACGAAKFLECNKKVREFIQRLLVLDWKNPVPFSVNGLVLMQTEKILIEYLFCCLDKRLNSTDFIRKITNINGF